MDTPDTKIRMDCCWTTAVMRLRQCAIGRHGLARLDMLFQETIRKNDARELKEFYRSTLEYL